LRFYIVEREADWPMVPRWGHTPTFYFFRDGELVFTVIGWKGDATKVELLRGLEALNRRP
jgi:hypothetical protein